MARQRPKKVSVLKPQNGFDDDREKSRNPKKRLAFSGSNRLRRLVRFVSRGVAARETSSRKHGLLSTVILHISSTNVGCRTDQNHQPLISYAVEQLSS
jgi:hypothetical protein